MIPAPMGLNQSPGIKPGRRNLIEWMERLPFSHVTMALLLLSLCVSVCVCGITSQTQTQLWTVIFL